MGQLEVQEVEEQDLLELVLEVQETLQIHLHHKEMMVALDQKVLLLMVLVVEVVQVVLVLVVLVVVLVVVVM